MLSDYDCEEMVERSRAEGFKAGQIEERRYLGYFLDEKWIALGLNTLGNISIPKLLSVIEALKRGEGPE